MDPDPIWHRRLAKAGKLLYNNDLCFNGWRWDTKPKTLIVACYSIGYKSMEVGGFSEACFHNPLNNSILLCKHLMSNRLVLLCSFVYLCLHVCVLIMHGHNMVTESSHGI